MTIQDVMKELSKSKILTSIHYDIKKDQCYLDLETMAKSHLHLYEDGILRGRYNYETQIDLNSDIEDIICILCFEFNRAKCGRDYYSQSWENKFKEITEKSY